MVHPTGIRTLVVGLFTLYVAAIPTGGVPVGVDFNGWPLLFQAGLLVASFGGVTLVLEPETPREVFGATGVSILFHALVAVVIGISVGTKADFENVLLGMVLPLAPMGVGYLAGALRSVPELSNLRYRTFLVVGVSLGTTLWLGGYVGYVIMNASAGANAGIAFIFYAVILAGDAVAGGVLYALWRWPEFTPGASLQ